MQDRKLVVFDLDGTLVDAPEFYRTVYSGTLNALIEEQRGREGLEVLRACRENYDGKGELALLALSIPFAAWAEKLHNASLELIPLYRGHVIAQRIHELDAKKVIYTGSPEGLAPKILLRFGFRDHVFDEIIGWKPWELFPLKWTSSTLVFEHVLRKFECNPREAWAIGDDVYTDLLPAHLLGMHTIGVQKPMTGVGVTQWRYRRESKCPEMWFPRMEECLNYLEEKIGRRAS